MDIKLIVKYRQLLLVGNAPKTALAILANDHMTIEGGGWYALVLQLRYAIHKGVDPDEVDFKEALQYRPRIVGPQRVLKAAHGSLLSFEDVGTLLTKETIKPFMDYFKDYGVSALTAELLRRDLAVQIEKNALSHSQRPIPEGYDELKDRTIKSLRDFRSILKQGKRLKLVWQKDWYAKHEDLATHQKLDKLDAIISYKHAQ